MADRYFVSSPIQGDRALLDGPEGHHLARVMRARPGMEVVLFDGTGGEFPATVERVARNEVELRVGARLAIEREAKRSITLGVALPKGDRQRWLIEKSVELGASRLIPLETARGVAQPADNALARLERGVIEAAKQCGRNRLMTIAAPQGWTAFLSAPPPTAQRWIAHPGGASPASLLARAAENPASPSELWLAVGPEGGLTDDEVEASTAAGWQTVGLGTSILRVETAATALAAFVRLAAE